MMNEADAADAAGAMAGHDLRRSTAKNYRHFGRQVRDRSPAYGALAEAVAADEQVLAFLEGSRRRNASRTCSSLQPGTCSTRPPTSASCDAWFASRLTS